MSLQDTRFTNLRAVVVKLTSRCNIKCEYCYEDITFGKEKHYYLPIDDFELLIDKMLTNSRQHQITIIFHGGEPSLLPISWLDRACEFSYASALRNNKSIEISMQTNFINISDDLMNCFKRNNIALGVSIDNPQDVTQSMRPLADKVIKNYFRAKENGVNCGILMTINQSNAHMFNKICNWLYADMGALSFKANVAYPVGAGVNLPPPTPSEIFKAKKDIIDYMIETKAECATEYHVTESMIHYVECHLKGVQRSQSLCDYEGCGAGTEVIGITPEGNILPCGRFSWNEKEYFLGHLKDKTVDFKIAYDKKLKRFFSIAPENWQDCGSCEARAICRFSCQAFIARSTLKANIECEATKMEFSYLDSIKESVVQIYPKLKLRSSLGSLLGKFGLEQIRKEKSENFRALRPFLENLFMLDLERKSNSKIGNDEFLMLINYLEHTIQNSDITG
ncbi:radical SAM/SPASM domain-containing protein [Legionella qingyii]|nr:radical SAM protein [Legionella qingyii]